MRRRGAKTCRGWFGASGQDTVADDGPGADQGPRGIILSGIVTRAAVRDYGEHRVVLPGRRCAAGLACDLCSITGKVHPSPAGPQISIIALLASAGSRGCDALACNA